MLVKRGSCFFWLKSPILLFLLALRFLYELLLSFRGVTISYSDTLVQLSTKFIRTGHNPTIYNNSIYFYHTDLFTFMHFSAFIAVLILKLGQVGLKYLQFVLLLMLLLL